MRTSPCRKSHAVNHHSPEVTARPTMTQQARSEPFVEDAAQGAEDRQRGQHRQQPDGPAPVGARPRRGKGSPPRAEIHALQRRRERGREEDREHEAEHAGRLADVVRRREALSEEHERVTLNPESGRHGGDDGRPDPLGREGGDDDHEREERDEGLPSERDAAVDELDLEQAFPHSPDEQPFQPCPHRVQAMTSPAGLRAAGGLLVLSHPRVSVSSPARPEPHRDRVREPQGGALPSAANTAQPRTP